MQVAGTNSPIPSTSAALAAYKVPAAPFFVFQHRSSSTNYFLSSAVLLADTRKHINYLLCRKGSTIFFLHWLLLWTTFLTNSCVLEFHVNNLLRISRKCKPQFEKKKKKQKTEILRIITLLPLCVIENWRQQVSYMLIKICVQAKIKT